MTLEQALVQVQFVVENSGAPSRSSSPTTTVSLSQRRRWTIPAPDTRLNAQRKAYTAARNVLPPRPILPRGRAGTPQERSDFDPFFTFFQGGVAAFEDGRRVGAVGVSGLPRPEDDALARRAIEESGLSTA